MREAEAKRPMLLREAGKLRVHFWLYVSRSAIPEVETTSTINEIVRVSQERNAALGITGALVYSDFHFGQIIEGSPESIMALRSSILSDPRHTSIKTIADGKTSARRFGRWSLAYAGASMVISRALQGSIRDAAHGNDGAGDELLRLMDDVLTPQ